MTDKTRRGFFGTVGGAGLVATGAAGLAGTAGLMLAGTPAALAGVSGPGPADPGATLRDLLAGNQRWVSGQPEHPRQSVSWREHLAPHQDPAAVVLSCIDSRVPPELVFDCGLGDMFVVRTGAQTLDRGVVLGSVEFGPVNYRATRLIVILGHSGCGAVSAAISVISSGGRAPGHIQAVVDALRPAYRASVDEPGDPVDNMVRAQTRLTVERLKRDRTLRELIVSDGLLIVGGHYDLYSGEVTIFC